MQLREDKYFDMVATIAAGIMANPANAQLSMDQYWQQQVLTNVLNALQQTIMQAWCYITPDESQ